LEAVSYTTVALAMTGKLFSHGSLILMNKLSVLLTTIENSVNLRQKCYQTIMANFASAGQKVTLEMSR